MQLLIVMFTQIWSMESLELYHKATLDCPQPKTCLGMTILTNQWAFAHWIWNLLFLYCPFVYQIYENQDFLIMWILKYSPFIPFKKKKEKSIAHLWCELMESNSNLFFFYNFHMYGIKMVAIGQHENIVLQIIRDLIPWPYF